MLSYPITTTPPHALNIHEDWKEKMGPITDCGTNRKPGTTVYYVSKFIPRNQYVQFNIIYQKIINVVCLGVRM